MKKTRKMRDRRSVTKHARFFRLSVFASILLALGVATAIAGYASRSDKSPANSGRAAASNTGNDKFVTVDVGGKKIRVNAVALQQGPLTQDETRAIADALKDNKSTEGLVQVQHADGSIEMDLQGRFQDMMIAKKNDDGSVSQACVDNPEAARAFLENKQSTSPTGPNRKAALEQ